MTRWRAEKGKTYFYISYDVKVGEAIEDFDKYDDAIYESGNYFRTFEEAVAVSKKFRGVLKRHHKKQKGDE